MLRRLVPARGRGSRCPAGEPMEAKLALARFIVARSHGAEAAEAAEAHFTRVVREGGAPDEVPEAPLPDGDPLHLPALLAAAFGLSTSDARRMIAPGRRQARRRRSWPSSTCRARSSQERFVQAGKRRFVRCSPADARLTQHGQMLLLSTGRPRGRQQNRPCHSTPERPSSESDTTRTESSVRPLARVGGFFAARPRPAPIFENSTACVKRRGLSSLVVLGVARSEVTPSSPFWRTRRFSRRCRTEPAVTLGRAASACG